MKVKSDFYPDALVAHDEAPEGYHAERDRVRWCVVFLAVNPYFCPIPLLTSIMEENRAVASEISDADIAALLLDWYARQGRDLPWRRTRDPYRIWISEVILQQTRVAQGLDYYRRFLERFPDVAALAAASEDEVLKCWQGLGYYSRARNLHAAARQIISCFGGRFPVDYSDVRSLSGVGDYTAAAICSIAYDAPYAVLDGNVFRVLSRLFDLDLPIDSTKGKKEFQRLAQALLDPAHPGLYNQAIMDFGALCCLPSQPRCQECPLQHRCLAFGAGNVSSRPVKQGKTRVEPRYFNYLHIICGSELLLARRERKDIWQGLYEFPLIETPSPMEYLDLIRTDEFRRLFDGVGEWRLSESVVMPPHQLSHQSIRAVFYRLEVDRWSDAMRKLMVVEQAHLDSYAIPRLIERYLTR